MLSLAFILLQISAVSVLSQHDEHIYDVIRYGADNSAKEPSTTAIQRAIDEAATTGSGGTVLFPDGQYLTGPIELKSGVFLHLADGAKVTFLADLELYPPMKVDLPDGKTEDIELKPLIRAFGQKHFGIRGRGVLDGTGTTWWERMPHATRPVFIHFFDCEDILVESVRIQNSPMFNLQIVDSSEIIIRNIHIDNPPTGGGKNTDGLNLYSVRQVHIYGVKITTGDDCIALKALGIGSDAIPTENVLIEESQMLGGHGGLSIGSEITGGAKNVTIRNCYFRNTIRGLQIKTNRIRGGTIEKIYAHNITMHKIQWEAIAITTYYSFKKKDESLKPVNATTPFIRNIEYDQIRGDCTKSPVLIDGLPESYVNDVVISNMDVRSGRHIELNNTRNVFINGRKWS